jgi:magnesium-transporting ATPase (P-type)
MEAVAILVDGQYFSLQENTIKDMKKYSQIWNIAAHCNDANLPNIGDPTEIALLEKANEMGIKKTKSRTDEIPFSSENKYMVTIHNNIGYLK